MLWKAGCLEGYKIYKIKKKRKDLLTFLVIQKRQNKCEENVYVYNTADLTIIRVLECQIVRLLMAKFKDDSKQLEVTVHRKIVDSISKMIYVQNVLSVSELNSHDPYHQKAKGHRHATDTDTATHIYCSLFTITVRKIHKEK